MPLSSEDGSDNDSFQLVATLGTPKHLVALLKSVHFKNNAMVFVTIDGMKVTVEDSKCLQANAFIEASMFHSYVIREEILTFKISLSVFLECLNIFGSGVPGKTPSIKICYKGHGSPLTIILEDSGVVTTCKLKTMEPEDILDFNFDNSNIVNKVIMKSDALKDFFQELDGTSEVLQILLSPDPPYFRLSTFGLAGNFHFECLKDSEMMEFFQCNQTQANRYKTALIKPSFKALALSDKICIRTDERGFLGLQYMIVTEDFHTAFVEYFCSPDEDMEEEQYNGN